MLDGPDSLQAEQIGENSLHHPSVGQHVGNATGHAQVIFQHHEFAAGQPDQIGADHRDIDVARHLQSAHLAAKVLAAVNHFAGNHSFGKNAAFVVNIPQKQIESSDPLRQSTFDVGPFRAGDEARQKIVGKDSLGSLLPAIYREGDALIQE